MIEHIIIQTIFRQWIVDIVLAVGVPVLIELLGTKHQYSAIAALKVFDDAQGCECLSKTYAISQNTTIIFLQLIDDGQCCIALEVVEFVPDGRVLETCCLLRQFVLADVL